jgi:hypothetical protein
MKTVILLILLSAAGKTVHSQKIDSIFFNLYTDSLKKGFHNYINVDGKTAEGRWMPLTAKELKFTANTGKFEGNDIIIDSAYTGETVKIKAELKANPAVWKEITIYIRKRGFTEILKTNEEIIDELKNQKVKVKQKNSN